MQIWKTKFHTRSGESAGFGYGKTKQQSIENFPESATGGKVVESKKIFVGYSESGILAALNEHASHPDNG